MSWPSYIHHRVGYNSSINYINKNAVPVFNSTIGWYLQPYPIGNWNGESLFTGYIDFQANTTILMQHIFQEILDTPVKIG